MNVDMYLDQVITPEKHIEIRKKLGLKTNIWKFSADAVVIGSGAGGAVAAAELSAKGLKVILIEEGSFFGPDKFSPDEYQGLARMYRDGGIISEEEGRVSILQGRTLGGSTTVNWQASLYPENHVTEEWKTNFGLEGYGKKEMSTYIDQVHQRIGVHEVPVSMRNENNNVLFKGARAMSLNPEVLKNNSRGCVGLGRCSLGCPINAKQSMSLTYIPDAIANGATVVTNMQAVKIFDGDEKKVLAEFSPDRFESIPSGIFEKMEITARVVIISGGAIESPALILRSGLGNSMVGKHLKIHPTQTIFAKFNREINMFQGIPQSVVISKGLPANNGYGFWMEAAPYRLNLTTALVPFYGKEQFKTMKNYRNFHAGIVLARDGAGSPVNSSVEWKFGKRKIYYKLSDADAANMLLGLKTLAEVQTAAGATELILPFRSLTKPFPVRKGQDFSWILSESQENFFAVGSAHPQGSIQASADLKTGAVAPNFELYGHKNIFVMDASVFPTALGVNPQITTMAVIMRAARTLAASLALPVR
ncbi:MAG: GMC family oxidoreductase N-terminal domain-containing protein [Spirochaetia bacterium]|nr:GMC family oxidoreductase N-terminal domain-containing protein [Spirochaetia bacterium]